MTELVIYAIAGGTAAASIGAIAAGNAQKAALNYNADINERNAQVAEQQIDQLRIREEKNIAKFRKDYKAFSDAQSQAFRYNGWIASEGTPLKVALASAAEADEEIATRRYNAKLGEQSLRESALEQRMQANLNRIYGKQAQRAGFMQAGQSLLSGASGALQTSQFAGSA